MKEFMGLDEVLGNRPVEVCVLGDGRSVRVRALTLRQASVWCEEARRAVGVIARAQELRELAAKQRTKALEAGDADALMAAGDTRDGAADMEAGYWTRVEKLVGELVRWGAVTGGGAESGVWSLESGGKQEDNAAGAAAGDKSGGRGQGAEDGARLEPGEPRGRGGVGMVRGWGNGRAAPRRC